MFSAYFVFHCLNMLCVEKQMSEFFRDSFATRKNFHSSTRNSPIMKPQLRVHLEAFATHLATHENFHDSPSREMPRNSFLKSFSWKTCF